jgi:hypothetical protein
LTCRWLHPDDPARSYGSGLHDDGTGFTSEEHREPPEPRTHEESMCQGKQAEDYWGADKNNPRHQTGIKGWCPLGELPMFDIIWDICPDMMHIIKNLFERFFGSLLEGLRVPKPPKSTFKPPRHSDPDYDAKFAAHDLEMERHALATEKATTCTLSQYGKHQVDIRCRKLSKIKHSGIPHSMVPFRTLPGRGKQKAAAWVKVLRFYVPYLLYGVGDKKVREALLLLSDALREVLDTTCDYYPYDDEKTQDEVDKCWTLKRKLIKALVSIEARLPESELSYFVHEIVHVADFTFRWNNVRNYWCFVTERFVGYVKGFVKNRHLVLENLVHTHILTVCSL